MRTAWNPVRRASSPTSNGGVAASWSGATCCSCPSRGPRSCSAGRSSSNVDRRTRALDPNYSVYSAEEFEVATLTLDVYDRKSRTLVWSDREQQRLRTTGQRFGGRLAEDFTPTAEHRNWQVYGMVDALLARLPR